MAHPRHPVSLAACLLALLLAPAAPAADTPFTPEIQRRLDLLKTGYETFLLKTAELPFESSLQRLNASVRPALERESSAAAQRKDLDALVRIKADLFRLDHGHPLTATDEAPRASERFAPGSEFHAAAA